MVGVIFDNIEYECIENTTTRVQGSLVTQISPPVVWYMHHNYVQAWKTCNYYRLAFAFLICQEALHIRKSSSCDVDWTGGGMIT